MPLSFNHRSKRVAVFSCEGFAVGDFVPVGIGEMGSFSVCSTSITTFFISSLHPSDVIQTSAAATGLFWGSFKHVSYLVFVASRSTATFWFVDDGCNGSINCSWLAALPLTPLGFS